jgi:AraC-like DNA-binding protein
VALVDCKEPVFDRQVDEILRLLEEGMERAEIAEKLGYKNPMSLDNYMRRRNFSWDSRQKMFVPAAERYSAKLNNNVLPLHGTSKAALVISLFAQDGADAKEIARQVGFDTHTELAGYMGRKGYEWDSTERNYVKGSPDKPIAMPQTDEPAGQGEPGMHEVLLNNILPLLKKLQEGENQPAASESKSIPRYQVQGMYGTKAMRMANVLDELARRFSMERNISQREMFEVALIEFFQKYGYREEVEKYLLG